MKYIFNAAEKTLSTWKIPEVRENFFVVLLNYRIFADCIEFNIVITRFYCVVLPKTTNSIIRLWVFYGENISEMISKLLFLLCI